MFIHRKILLTTVCKHNTDPTSPSLLFKYFRFSKQPIQLTMSAKSLLDLPPELLHLVITLLDPGRHVSDV